MIDDVTQKEAEKLKAKLELANKISEKPNKLI